MDKLERIELPNGLYWRYDGYEHFEDRCGSICLPDGEPIVGDVLGFQVQQLAKEIRPDFELLATLIAELARDMRNKPYEDFGCEVERLLIQMWG